MSAPSKPSEALLQEDSADAIAAAVIDRSHLTVLARGISQPGRSRPPTDAKLVTLHTQIGEGGMAVVWGGTQERLLRQVAVKVARRMDPADQARLLKEALLTARLEHPNIVPIHDVVSDGHGNVSVVMKRLRGEPWSQLMQDKARVLERFFGELLDWNLRVLCDVARAVAYAHEHGVVHRDIKPSNVMIGLHGEVTLLDWGVAAAWAEGEPELPQLEDAPIAGTLAYMSPEQLEGDCESQGPWTDVFLLGATLYQVLAGKPPFAGVDAEQARAHPRQRAYPPLGPDVSPELRSLVDEALEQDVAERMLSADDFLAALERSLKQRGSMNLATAAARRLEAGSPDEACLTEAEVGFRAALEIWAENPSALGGLHTIALRRVEIALEQDLPERAQSLLQQLDAVPPELSARVRAAVTANNDQQQRAREALQQVDVTHDAQRRRSLLLVVGPLWPLAWLGFALWPPRELWPFALFLGGCMLGGSALVLTQGREPLQGLAHRTNILCAGLAVAASFLWVLICMRLGLGSEAMYLGIQLSLAGLLASFALTYDARGLPSACIKLACLGLTLAYPAAAPWTMFAGTVAWATMGGLNNWRATRTRAMSP